MHQAPNSASAEDAQTQPAAATAISGALDGRAAVGAVLQAVRRRVPDPGLVLLAAGARYPEADVAAGLREHGADLPLLGASAAAVFTEEGWLETGAAAFAWRPSGKALGRGRLPLHANRPGWAAEELARQVPREPHGVELLFLADVALPDWDAFWHSFREARPDVTACGACSVFDTSLPPQHPRFLTDWQAYGGELTRDELVWAAFAGPAGRHGMQFAFGHGFVEVGRPARVTRAEGDVIREIDGRPARDHFRKYIGDAELRVDGYGNLVCFVMPRRTTGIATPKYSLPLAFLPDGAVQVLSAIPAGTDITLAASARRDLVEAARSTALRARGACGGEPDGLLCFSCAGRYIALGRRVADEVEAVRRAAGANVPLWGFHSGAEFAPEGTSRGPTIYNAYSATVVALAGSTGGTP
jgi:hypothetical protein